MRFKRSFASDNCAPAHPRVMEALARVNADHVVSYGGDAETKQAVEKFREIFGSGAEVFFVFNGTGANVVSLQAITRSYGAILCSEVAHIHTDECGAPEKISQNKLVTLPAADGKLSLATLEAQLARRGDHHAVQPQAVSLTQSTEYGTVYTVREIQDICRWAHAHGLLVHMDGARIGNAAATLKRPVREFTVDAGVDILSFGGTKNGMMMGEAVVAFDPKITAELRYLRKQSMQLASKMRYISAQFIAVLGEGLFLELAGHANRMAQMLAVELGKIPGVRVNQKVEANAVFASFPAGDFSAAQEKFHFYMWREEKREARLMCSWDTTEEDVLEFVFELARAFK